MQIKKLNWKQSTPNSWFATIPFGVWTIVKIREEFILTNGHDYNSFVCTSLEEIQDKAQRLFEEEMGKYLCTTSP